MISPTGKKNECYHRPVLVEETAAYLIGRADGVYVDLTCGGGGHLANLSRVLAPEAVLIGVDRDPDAVATARQQLNTVPQVVTIVQSTFDRIDDVIGELGHDAVDGVLFDLGVSSHQIDTAGRGFSFMHDGPLDMRMGPDVTMTAEEVVNNYSEHELARIFHRYGEEKRSRRAASAIVAARQRRRITTTGHLYEVLAPVMSPQYRTASLARIFQAIRIEINREMEQLEQALPKAVDCLAPGGRLVTIAYHSLEDRIIKRFLADEAKGCLCPPKLPVCVCGRTPRVRPLTRRVVTPTDEEINANSRATSAKLRAAEKLP